MSEPRGDERYYGRLFNLDFIYGLSHAPRRAMFDFFMRELRPTEKDTVLDLGATSLPDTQENMFELYYPHPGRVTAAGTEDCSFLEKRHPGLKFVRIADGKPLPFADDAFDIGFSNAVIEHAGSREKQAFFLRELIRVSRRCFVTTPNRWFPVELHTRLPFAHWLPASAFRAVLAALGFSFYAREENLNLLTAAELRGLLPPGLKSARLARQWFFGLPSNLMLVIEK
jgi:SAM-dependent methyltransferase